ncbi:hypothetical protein OnM2_022074 [Erysiphe neolycopersici]|uniref:Retrovirus-related Pol polyprotein from transposon TNT 1-94-like beta-barrel domain-containing protein n=1 Tax=Erysiphe neolycopersici TaxID=212602 RepID=A0A420I2E5_9PEZI|nr:hypothetical protein OnM2_022074 [Erysiphe neolycopersici]
MTTNMGNSSVMLRGSKDWDAFWFALENLLSAPELPQLPKAPELPQRPEATETDHLKPRVSKQWEKYDALSGTFFKHLLALKNQFAPTDRARELQVIRLYCDALVYGENEPIIRWLDNYQQAYEKSKEVNIPEITGYRAHYDFIYGIKSIDAEYSKYISIQLEKKRKKCKVPFLKKMIEYFRNHQRQEQASIAFDRDIQNRTKAVIAAMFKDEAEIKVNKNLEKNSENFNERNVIKKYGYDGLSNDIFEETNQSVQNAGAASLELVNQKAAAVLTMRQSKSFSKGNIRSLRVFLVEKKDHRQIDDNFHLSNKWIIDNDTDTHVTNSSRNFKETKKASPGEALYTGKGAYAIKSYGNVVLPLKSNVVGEYLLLMNAAYVHGFMTNCVSLDKLTKANIHWNSRNPSILEREDDSVPFCHIFQTRSHWVFDEPDSGIVMSSSLRRKSMASQ